MTPAEFRRSVMGAPPEGFQLVLKNGNAGRGQMGLHPNLGAKSGQTGPHTNLGGCWTNDSAIGTCDHHDAGWVDVRPGQGCASRRGASEHGTAESRGGRGRG